MKVFCFKSDDQYQVEYVDNAIIDELIACGGVAPKELENGSLEFSAVEWELLCRAVFARQQMDFLTAELERRKKVLIDEAVETNNGLKLESVRDDIADVEIILKDGLEELGRTLLYKVADYPTRLNLEAALYQQAVDMLGDTAATHGINIYL